MLSACTVTVRAPQRAPGAGAAGVLAARARPVRRWHPSRPAAWRWWAPRRPPALEWGGVRLPQRSPQSQIAGAAGGILSVPANSQGEREPGPRALPDGLAMAGAFGGVQSLTELPAFSSQHTRYALSAEDAKRDARLYDVLTEGLESYGANNKSSELRKKPTFFRRDRGASIIWDADDNIELLRRRLVDAGELKADDDEYLNHPVESVLARFLRAREGNTDEAYDQFMRMCAWRREEAVDRIVEEDFPEHAQLEALYPHYFMRTDRLQRPVSYVNLGGSDLDKILELMSPERFLRYDLLLRELAMRYHYPKLWGEYGTCIDQSVCIVDLKGFSLSQFSKQARELMTRAAHKDQEFYPEMLGKAFVINAPTTFRYARGRSRPPRVRYQTFADARVARLSVYLTRPDADDLAGWCGPY